MPTEAQMEARKREKRPEKSRPKREVNILEAVIKTAETLLKGGSPVFPPRKSKK